MSQLHRRTSRGDGGYPSEKEERHALRTPLKPSSNSALRAELWAFVALAAIAGLVVLYVRLRPGPKEGPTLETQERLFTPEALRAYDGQHSKKIYVAVMGHVFDVSAGARHYGKGGGYSFFAGRDASRAYVTGQFQQDLNDDVAQFTAEEFQGLAKWRDFFLDHKEYKLVGHVVGRFFDADGHPTPLLGRAEALARQEEEATERRKQERRRQQQQQHGPGGADTGRAGGGQHTPCNVRWTKAEGGAVWCPDGQFPRQVAVPGRDSQLSMRCACFAEDMVDASRRLYPNCQQSAQSCSTSPPE